MSDKKCADEHLLLHLKPRDIREYEGNPRKLKNPKSDEIYQSIFSVGLEQPLVVTQRPGESGYLLHSGGNTRLWAVKKIWRETRDARFATIPCLFRPWQGEHEVLLSHFLENELRGAMTYLERTQAIIRLVENYLKKDDQLSLREMVERLNMDGVSTSATGLHHMLECHRFIWPAMPTTLLQGLSRADVVRLLTLRSELFRAWEKSSGNENGVNFNDCWVIVLASHDMGLETFNIERIRSEVTTDMTSMLGLSPKLLEVQPISERERKNEEVNIAEAGIILKKLDLQKRLVELVRQLSDKHQVYGFNVLESDVGLCFELEDVQAATPKGELLGQVLAHALCRDFFTPGVVGLMLGNDDIKLDDTDAKKLFEVFFLLRQIPSQGGAE